LKYYRIVSKTVEGKRLGAIAMTRTKVLEAVGTYSAPHLLEFIPFEVSATTVQFAVAASDSIEKDLLIRLAKMLINKVSPKLTERRVKTISSSEFIHNLVSAWNGILDGSSVSKNFSSFTVAGLGEVLKASNDAPLSIEKAQEYLFFLSICVGMAHPDKDVLQQILSDSDSNAYTYDNLIDMFQAWHWNTPAIGPDEQPSENGEEKQQLYCPPPGTNVEGQNRLESMSCQPKSGLEKLDELVGLDEVKLWIKKIVAYAAFTNASGGKAKKQHLNMFFTGNPGTAKSTVARILGLILYEAGLLESSEVVEASRAQLCGKYVAQTAPQTEEWFIKAQGTILLIDEAYELVDGDGKGSYGQEAIDTLVRLMENSPETICIFAGYPDRMEDLLKENEGLRSRIKFVVNFPDYSEEQMYEILERMSAESNYVLDQNVKEHVMPMFVHSKKDRDSGNGRFVRNIFEVAEINLSFRFATSLEDIPKRDGRYILFADDFEEPDAIKGRKEPTHVGFNVMENKR